jgi:hypothetical protein
MRSGEITKSILVVLFVGFICSCSSMNSLTIPVTEPAPVQLPSDIKSVGILDRSLPTEENRQMDEMDKYLSIEGKNLDKDAAETTVVGLFDELKSFDRFIELKIIDNSDLKSPGMGVFSAPISWIKVDQICQENNIDAIFVLSFYDTDAKVDFGANSTNVEAVMGIKIPMVETEITIDTQIKTGWRIYDPASEMILDEFIIYDKQISSGRGINPMKAAQAIIDRKEAVLQVSGNIGHNYALRILPYNTRVNREYFVKGTNNFEIAKRRAQTGDWEGAAQLWEKETSNSKGKIAGRAYYNMAISSEINGNLDAAVDWASKSYTDYKIKDALDYLKILKYRMTRVEQLQQQMH